MNSNAQIISDPDFEAQIVEHVEALCTKFDQILAEEREQLWQLMKIPIAPASIIGAGVHITVQLALAPKEIGITVLTVDVVWALYKILSSVAGRCHASSQRDGILINIQDILDCEQISSSLPFTAIFDRHDPELKLELSKLQLLRKNVLRHPVVQER